VARGRFLYRAIGVGICAGWGRSRAVVMRAHITHLLINFSILLPVGIVALRGGRAGC
jgi:hypothetical protein